MRIINTITIALASLVFMSHGYQPQAHEHKYLHRRQSQYANNTIAAVQETSSTASSSSISPDNGVATFTPTTSSISRWNSDSAWPISSSSSEISPVSSMASPTSNLDSDTAWPALYSSSEVKPVSIVTSSTSTSIGTEVTDATITYTQGTGSTKTVVTTTIHMTKTFTITDTIYATLSPTRNGAGAAPNTLAADVGTSTAASAHSREGVSLGSSMSSDSWTTTLTTTSMALETITVEPVTKTGQGLAATGIYPAGAVGEGECSIAVVTTVVQSTVYVTATSSSQGGPVMSSPIAKTNIGQLSSLVSPMFSSSTASSSSISAGEFFPKGNRTDSPTQQKFAGTGFLTLSSGRAVPTGWKS